MRVVASIGKEDIAVVYILELEGGRLVECVESLQPPLPRGKKWVLLVSTLSGCPIGCRMCDAGSFYQGKLSKEEILSQIDFLIRKRFPDRRVDSQQLKIQFARIGEPSLNPAVLEVLDELPDRYTAPGMMPSVSTVAPASSRPFFERLLEIKQKHYSGGRFQFQFSIHATDPAVRDRIIPVKKWSLAEMAEYGNRFFAQGDRKITLNFAPDHGMAIEPDVLLKYFSPEKFLVKITPLNPTHRALENHLVSYIDPAQPHSGREAVDALHEKGYETIVSIGEIEENFIGSNCGQYLRTHLDATEPIKDAYTYDIIEHGTKLHQFFFDKQD